MTTSTLEHTVQRAARGDVSAFEQLVQRYANLVTSVALGVVRNVPASEDVAQDVFATAWTRLHQLKDPRSFPGWLRQITRNRAKEYLRETARDQRLAAAADVVAERSAGSAEGLLLAKEREEVLAEGLDALPDDARDVLVLYYREGNSVYQVADLLELEPSTVRKRMSRARNALRTEVSERLEGAARGTAVGAAFVAAVMAALGPVPAHAASQDPASSGWLKAMGGVGASMVLALLVFALLPPAPEVAEPAVPSPAAAAPRLLPPTPSQPAPALPVEEERVDEAPADWPPVPASPYQEALFAFAEAARYGIVRCDPALIPEGTVPFTGTVDGGYVWLPTPRADGGIVLWADGDDRPGGELAFENAEPGVEPSCVFEPPMEISAEVEEQMEAEQARGDFGHLDIDGETVALDDQLMGAMIEEMMVQADEKKQVRSEAELAAVRVALTQPGLSREATRLLEERAEWIRTSGERSRSETDRIDGRATDADREIIDLFMESAEDRKKERQAAPKGP